MKAARERHEEYLKQQEKRKQDELKMMQDQNETMRRIMDQKNLQTSKRNEEVNEYLKQ